ncbi:MAG TPA: hypothetical protein VIF62_31015 [Labilithrix sp.]|jgi:hypothetical protein
MSAKPVPPNVPDLASEVREAIADIDSGNYLALTPEQLEQWAATGELRALDEWLDESHD